MSLQELKEQAFKLCSVIPSPCQGEGQGGVCLQVWEFFSCTAQENQIAIIYV